MTAAAPILPPPKLSYRHVFDLHEHAAIKRCNDEHGFAIIRQAITPEKVAELKADVAANLNSKGDLKAGETRFHLMFAEVSPALRSLFDHEGLMSLYAYLLGTRDMTLNRSAALLKAVGAPLGNWHTDWKPVSATATDANSVLNTHDYPNGFWFYLNGTHPSRGGLAIIEDSHKPDWPGPEGYELAEQRASFYRRGEKPSHCDHMDVPGCIPLYTDPGDLIIFAARTYHGVFPHNGVEPRMSCAFIMRPRSHRMTAPWPLSDQARKFVADLPERHRGIGDGYLSIDPSRKPKY